MKHSNCCVCTRACVCVRVSARARVCVCVCHYEKKIAVVVLVVSSRLLCCSNLSRPCCGKGFALLSSVSASQNFTAHYTFVLLLCRKVGGGRKTASKMSAKRVYEQARATLRTEQRGTNGRVKEHKRQRKQILSLSVSVSLSLSLSLSLSVSPSLSFSFSLYASVTIFFFIWIDLLFNDKHIDTACFLCLFPFFLFSFVCLLMVWVLT